MYRSIILLLVATVFTLISFSSSQSTGGCEKKYDKYDSFMCVCNATYCDYPPTSSTPSAGNFVRIVSSRDEYRFERFEAEKVVRNNSYDIINDGIIFINRAAPTDGLTVIKGFGGAFTDAATLNIKSLSQGAQDNIMTSYFDPSGIEYNLCRVPIAGSDFSTRPYSYDEVEGDIELVNFNLTFEDFDYKIPLIKVAQNLTNNDLWLFGSPWAPPYWMKENQMYNGSGGLLPEMWEPYSNYLIKFIQEYEKLGVNVWGLTPQNEPMTGFQDWMWNTCAWSAEDIRDWVKTYFGPALIAAGYADKQFMVFDHNRNYLPDYGTTIYADPDAAQYIAGTAVHWYDDVGIWYNSTNTTAIVLDQLHDAYPEKFILYTEACEGFYGEDGDRVHLGSWPRAEKYTSDIIENLNHHSTGWVDWNMALDMEGGPNWAGNLVDSPILIEQETDTFYKQPTFYSMGHFSKYLKRDGIVLPSSSNGNANIEAVAVRNPSGLEAITIMNRSNNTMRVLLEDENGPYIDFDMNARSIETVIYDPSN